MMVYMMMSDQERQRKAYLEMVRQEKLTLVKAAQHLDMSYRQAKRVYKRYITAGDGGLIP